MKLISLLITFLYLTQISNAQKPRVFLTNNELKGKVKKVTTYYFGNRKSQTDTLQQPDITTLEFDEKGNILKETHFRGKLRFFKIDYRYGVNSVIGKKFDPDGSFAGRLVYKYDEHGNRVEIRREGTVFGPPRQVFKNDTNGHPIEIDNYVDDNTLGSKVLIKYNENGLESSQGLYKINGGIYGSESYTYDTLKNLIKYERYYSDGHPEGNEVFTYSDWDQNGNWHVKTIISSHEPSDPRYDSYYIIIKRSIEYY